MNPSAHPRLAFIGCGDVAVFHAAACREAGFALAAVAGRPGSARAPEFARRFGVPRVFSDPLELASSGDWDALVLAVEPVAALDLLAVAAASGRPVLVEKPVALSSEMLRPHATRWPNVMVGYNRRFYATVREARAFAASGPPCLAQLEIPEDAPFEAPSGADPTRVFTHSVHGFDLARYVLGPLAMDMVLPRLRDAGGAAGGAARDGVAALMRSRRGDVVQYVGNWNAPANVSLTLDQGMRRYQLRPFESGAVYEGLTVVEPDAAMPIRRYVPTLTRRVALDPCDHTFKPGFLQQAAALLRRCGGEQDDTAATLEDAVAALELAEAVTASPSSGVY